MITITTHSTFPLPPPTTPYTTHSTFHHLPHIPPSTTRATFHQPTPLSTNQLHLPPFTTDSTFPFPLHLPPPTPPSPSNHPPRCICLQCDMLSLIYGRVHSTYGISIKNLRHRHGLPPCFLFIFRSFKSMCMKFKRGI